MPRPDYRIPSRRERELFKQVRDLRERLDSLSRDPSATLEISRLEGIVAERDSAIAALESELESERARTARLRGELESSRAKRKGLESQVRQHLRRFGTTLPSQCPPGELFTGPSETGESSVHNIALAGLPGVPGRACR